MSKEERIKLLRSYGFSYNTISNNSIYWSEYKITSGEVQAICDGSGVTDNKYVINYSEVGKCRDVSTVEHLVMYKNAGMSNKYICDLLGIRLSSLKHLMYKYVIINK